MQKAVHIDESGSPILGTDHYVLAATFTVKSDAQLVESVLERVRKEHFSGAEIKSSRVGSNLKRRCQIASKLAECPARVEVLVIKKDRLDSNGGFRFRSPMYKYCQRRLFEKIYRGLSGIDVVIDTFGNEEFRNGFSQYIDKHYQPSLFSTKSVRFSRPEDEPILQLSDFVAGTVRRHFNEDDGPSAYANIKHIINNLEIWPRVAGDTQIVSPDNELDINIRNHCAHAAEEFLANNTDKVLSETVQFMLYGQATDHEGFVYGDLILSHLQEMELAGSERDKSWLRQHVIATLREKGVLIAASRDGYKIPENQRDLELFVEFVGHKTIRYLERVVMMRDSIYYGTDMKHDMLSSSPELQNMLRPLRHG